MVDTTGGAGDAALAPAKALQPVRVRVDSVRRRLAGQRGFDVRRDGGIKVVASFLRVPAACGVTIQLSRPTSGAPPSAVPRRVHRDPRSDHAVLQRRPERRFVDEAATAGVDQNACSRIAASASASIISPSPRSAARRGKRAAARTASPARPCRHGVGHLLGIDVGVVGNHVEVKATQLVAHPPRDGADETRPSVWSRTRCTGRVRSQPQPPSRTSRS